MIEGRDEMQRHSLLTVVLLSVLILLGFQFLSQSSKALPFDADVDIKPDTLNLNMEGRWISAYIWNLPEPYNVSDIDTEEPILLEGVFPSESSNIEGEVLMVKFKFHGNTELIDYLRDHLYHMGGGWKRSVELRVTGQLVDGMEFSGIDTITIIDPVGK